MTPIVMDINCLKNQVVFFLLIKKHEVNGILNYQLDTETRHRL